MINLLFIKVSVVSRGRQAEYCQTVCEYTAVFRSKLSNSTDCFVLFEHVSNRLHICNMRSYEFAASAAFRNV